VEVGEEQVNVIEFSVKIELSYALELPCGRGVRHSDIAELRAIVFKDLSAQELPSGFLGIS
jgi:hypothetical protein